MGRNNQQRRRAKARTRRHRGQGAAFGSGPGPAPGPTAGTGRGPTADSVTREQAHDLVHLALWAKGRDSVAEERAVDRLAELAAADPRERLAASRLLIRMLHDHLATAWREGWQPADLHRVAARGVGGSKPGSAVELAVLVDAMADELATYAPDSLDGRWHAQLSELDAVRWWPADTDHLTARAGSATGGWRDVCRGALNGLDLIGRLPALEVIGPRPGEATAAGRAAAKRAGAVDERVLSRVRALLAKAESTTYQAEAETFTAGAQALMARHSIDVAMLDAKEDNRGGPGAVRIGIDRPYESPKALLLDVVAQANRCRAVWSQHLGFSTVLGFPPDLRAVEILFTSLLVQSTAAMQEEGARQTAWARSRTRSFRQSFLSAYAVRVGERLRDATRAEVDAAGAAAASSSSTPGSRSPSAPDAVLLPVLAARSRAVDEATEAMFPDLVTRAGSRVNDTEGWRRGRAAADQATLDLFASVE